MRDGLANADCFKIVLILRLKIFPAPRKIFSLPVARMAPCGEYLRKKWQTLPKANGKEMVL